MNKEGEKTHFIEQGYHQMCDLLALYKVVQLGDKAFKEDFFIELSDIIKGSYRNGITVGMNRKFKQNHKKVKANG